MSSVFSAHDEDDDDVGHVPLAWNPKNPGPKA